MNQTNKSYKSNSVTHKVKVTKKKNKARERRLPIVKYLVSDLNLFLSDFVPKSISEKVSLEAEQSFNYFLNKSIVDIFLFLTEKNSSWEVIFKVFPKYLSNKDNFVKIEKNLNNGVIIFDLKSFYLQTIKKYNI
jgi:hypothetical protein